MSNAENAARKFEGVKLYKAEQLKARERSVADARKALADAERMHLQWGNLNFQAVEVHMAEDQRMKAIKSEVAEKNRHRDSIHARVLSEARESDRGIIHPGNMKQIFLPLFGATIGFVLGCDFVYVHHHITNIFGQIAIFSIGSVLGLIFGHVHYRLNFVVDESLDMR